eukprot:3934918-Rhodomonas_salina.2
MRSSRQRYGGERAGALEFAGGFSGEEERALPDQRRAQRVQGESVRARASESGMDAFGNLFGGGGSFAWDSMW